MDPNTIALQVLASSAWPFIQQFFKNSNLSIFSWITQETPKINATIAALVALFTTAGWHFAGDIINGGTITFPPLYVWAKALAAMVLQNAVYHQFIKGPQVQKQILCELQKSNAPTTFPYIPPSAPRVK